MVVKITRCNPHSYLFIPLNRKLFFTQELLKAKKIKLACHAKPTEPQTGQSETEEPESSQPTDEPETKETVNSQPNEKPETKSKSYTPIEGPINRKQTYGNWESVKTYGM